MTLRGEMLAIAGGLACSLCLTLLGADVRESLIAAAAAYLMLDSAEELCSQELDELEASVNRVVFWLSAGLLLLAVLMGLL